MAKEVGPRCYRFFYTRQLIPEVGTKVCFPDNRDIGISYCRLLLHDTMLRDDSHRTGTSDTPVCACGLIHTELVLLIHLCVHVDWKENLLLTFYCIATDIRKQGIDSETCLLYTSPSPRDS